jgi:hypothetical protein
LYLVVTGLRDGYMRIVVERRSSRWTRSLAISTAETIWPLAGIGINTNSAFFISLLDVFAPRISYREQMCGLLISIWGTGPDLVGNINIDGLELEWCHGLIEKGLELYWTIFIIDRKGLLSLVQRNSSVPATFVTFF